MRASMSATRVFEARPAVRAAVPLLVGLCGPSGSGKTFSALRLASGIQSVTGGDIYGIDTESSRMLHYADMFKFQHLPFGPPFGSLDYLAALQHCVSLGARTIIVDSMSHEHEGTGGLLDTHTSELDRLGGDNPSKREAVKFLAWQKPKADRRRLINGILQLNANFVFCFRAKPSIKMVKVQGKTEVVPQGYMPIAGEEFVFEQTVCCLLLPHANGVPSWSSENVGERSIMKMPEQFKTLFADRGPLTEETGRALAEWARGSQVAASAPAPTAKTGTGLHTDVLEAIDKRLAEAAKEGMGPLSEVWKQLTLAQRAVFKKALDTRHKPSARAAEAARATEPAQATE
jgi:ABC-type dipeptide/oligopeptide/nickel transport system ATPase subunit